MLACKSSKVAEGRKSYETEPEPEPEPEPFMACKASPVLLLLLLLFASRPPSPYAGACPGWAHRFAACAAGRGP